MALAVLLIEQIQMGSINISLLYYSLIFPRNISPVSQNLRPQVVQDVSDKSVAL